VLAVGFIRTIAAVILGMVIVVFEILDLIISPIVREKQIVTLFLKPSSTFQA
jgi:hypothetical protein